jgi:STE24 endopeptidase
MVRSIEFAADKYSTDLGYGLSLRDGLVAIHVNNQANLNPDWLYSFFKFDHPPMIERLNAIDKRITQIAEEKTG